MKCVFCPFGETRPGTSSITLEREGTIIVVQEVPGEVCDTCGEAYYSDETTDELLKQAEQAYQDGRAIKNRHLVLFQRP